MGEQLTHDLKTPSARQMAEAMIPKDAFVLAVYLHENWKEFSL